MLHAIKIHVLGSAAGYTAIVAGKYYSNAFDSEIILNQRQAGEQL